MAPRKKTHRTEVRDIEVYAIIFPETNQVFIGKNRAPNHYQSYKDHVGGRKPLTKELFETAKQTNNFPKMYLLNRLETTETRAYRYIVAWTSFFLNKGFQVVGHRKTLAYAEDIYEETEEIFNEIKALSLEEITSEERVLVGSYSMRKEKSDAIPTNISLIVTPEEYLHIKGKADNLNMSISKYCVRTAVYGTVTHISLMEYAEELRSIKRVLREVQLGIYQSGKYFPADLENFEKMIDHINDNYKKVVRKLDKEFRKLHDLKNGK